MATIQSLGIGSGLLTSELLEGLIEAERAPQVNRLDRDQEIIEARLSAFGEVSSALSDFNSSMKALNSVSAFNASQVSSGNESALTATAGSTAVAGSYSVNIQALAQQHTVASQAYESVNEAVGTGTLNFRFGTTDIDGLGVYQSFTANPDKQNRSVVIDSSNNTLAGIREAVNAAKIGVQATIVDDGSGYRLLFNTTDGGEDNSIELTATGTAGMADFNFNEISQSMSQTQAAQDAQFTVNGLSVTRNSNSVVGVIPGVTLSLKATTAGPTTLSVSKDPAELMDKIQGVVDNYNALKGLTDALSSFDPEAGENGQGSLLTGDTGLRRIMNEVNSTLRAISTDNDVRSLAEIGIRTDQFSDYQLVFDRSTFTDAFAADAQAVTSLFAATGTPSDNQVSYLGVSSQTQTGSYALEITRMASVGRYEGISVDTLSAGNIVIDSTNRDFTIVLNGLETDVQLNEGTYATAEELAQELQQQINGNAEILLAESTVTVSFNAGEARFEMSSNRYGSDSVIRFVDVPAATSTTLGLVQDGSGPYRGNQLSTLATSDGQSSSLFNTPLLVDSDTQYSLSVNGISTGVLTLPGDAGTPVTYTTPDELTAALKSQIDTALAGDGIEVFVDYVYNADDDFGRLVFSTANAGDQLAFSDINLPAATRLGLFEGAGATPVSIRGEDVAGTINGIEAVGAGQLLTASSGSEPASPGFYLNSAIGDLSTSTANDKFRVQVDGVLSGEITLGVLANTDPETVAAGMQTAINNAPALLAAGVSVTVEYDINSGGFGIISNSFGSSSSVRVASLTGNAGAILGFAAGSGSLGETGQDASGEPDDSTGLRLQITGGEVGDRGTVTYSRGVASRMSSLIDSFLGQGGVLTGRQDALNVELDSIADKRIALDERIARSERRLASSFLANDIIISNFNSTADFLTSQLTMLEALATPQQKK